MAVEYIFIGGTYNILLIRSYLPRNGWREIIEGKSLIWWAKWFPFAFCSLSVKVSHQEINEIYWLGWMNMNKTNRHKDSSAAQQTQTIDDTSIMCLFQQLQARYVTILIWSLQKCRGQFERGSPHCMSTGALLSKWPARALLHHMALQWISEQFPQENQGDERNLTRIQESLGVGGPKTLRLLLEECL
jgi:hypothetical protein